MPAQSARNQGETPPPLRLARENRREDLLDAAAELIVDLGAEGVSMDAVAERAGVSRPLVYKHFGNRSEILTALYVRETSLVAREVTVAVRSAQTLTDMYRALVHAALGASASRGALLQTLRSAGAYSRDLRHEQRERDQQTVRFFAERATDELGIPSKQAAAVTGMLLTALDSVLGQWRARRTPANARLLEETYMDMVSGALEQVRQRADGATEVVAGGRS